MGIFCIGAARALVTVDRRWKTGGEMLLLGAIVAASAYAAGALVATLVGVR